MLRMSVIIIAFLLYSESLNHDFPVNLIESELFLRKQFLRFPPSRFPHPPPCGPDSATGPLSEAEEEAEDDQSSLISKSWR